MKDGELSDPIQTIDTMTGKPAGAADIHVTPDGRYVYASNRGHNSIVCYECKDMVLTKLHETDQTFLGGEGYRNFTISPDG